MHCNVVQLQEQCDLLRKSLDEQSANNVKQKELMDKLNAECNELKEVQLSVKLMAIVYVKCSCLEYAR